MTENAPSTKAGRGPSQEEAPVTAVPLLDLKGQYRSMKEEVDAAIKRVVDSQMFILGPEVESLEREIAAYCGCTDAVGVSSGTDALLAALMAYGIGPGHEVITAPFTFFATVGSILRVGAKPVFADIDPDTFNIDPDALKKAITSRTKAVMPVHLFGQCADMDPILAVAEDHGLVVIEDAAQAIGAHYRGRPAGSMGHVGCFSFFPSKNLGAFGDGGIVTTNDHQLAERIRVLRNQGMQPKYHHAVVGGNFRLDALQAAILRVKLTRLDGWIEARRANAAFYTRSFEETGLAGEKIIPPRVRFERHVFNQYVIRVRDRDALRDHLIANRVGTEIYYPKPVHLQECLKDFGCVEGEFPASEEASGCVLALPVYPELSLEQKRYVVSAIGQFYGE